MRLATITIVVRSDEEFTEITPSVNCEIEDGIPSVVGLAACVGGVKSALKALEAELDKHRTELEALQEEPDEELEFPSS